MSACSSADFVASWQVVLSATPEATAFQGPAFVASWYATYSPAWEPWLLVLRSEEGSLVALWPLAFQAGRWAVAGHHQAEYQGWAAMPGVQEEFLRQAWNWLAPRLGPRGLRLKYLASASQARALCELLGGHASTRVHSRPLLRLDPEEHRASMAKKGNKSRFNRLSRLGSLRFVSLDSAAEFDIQFDRLIDCYDLRQAATNKTAPFREDVCKRDFHRRLFACAGNQLEVHATLLDDRAIAGFWGMRSGSVVHLGMLIHSPILAEHSPGKLQVMKLSEALIAQGVQILDLTPGGDAWKERFANDHDEVYEVQIWARERQAWLAQKEQAWVARIKGLMAGVGVSPARARSLLSQARKATQVAAWLGLTRRGLAWVFGEQREYRVYRMDAAAARSMAGAGTACALGIKVNAMADLLDFKPGESWQRADEFWEQSVARLEERHLSYTIADGGTLLHFGWLGKGQRESRVSEVDQTLKLPEGTVCLYDFYTLPAARGRGYYRANVQAMLRDISAMPEVCWIYIGVMNDNKASRHVIETLGFEYLGSMHRFSRWGRVHASRDVSLEPIERVTHASP